MKMWLILFIGMVLSIGLVRAGCDVDQSCFSNLIGIEHTEGWGISHSSGDKDKFLVQVTDLKDKKTSFCFSLKPFEYAPVTTRQLYNCDGTELLDNKNKAIILKYESSKCQDGTDGYYISLTDEQSINIDDCFRLGQNSKELTYINITNFYSEYGELEKTDTYYIEKDTEFIPVLDTYWTKEDGKHGVNVTDWKMEYQPGMIIVETNKPFKIKGTILYIEEYKNNKLNQLITDYSDLYNVSFEYIVEEKSYIDELEQTNITYNITDNNKIIIKFFWVNGVADPYTTTVTSSNVGYFNQTFYNSTGEYIQLNQTYTSGEYYAVPIYLNESGYNKLNLTINATCTTNCPNITIKEGKGFQLYNFPEHRSYYSDSTGALTDFNLIPYNTVVFPGNSFYSENKTLINDIAGESKFGMDLTDTPFGNQSGFNYTHHMIITKLRQTSTGSFSATNNNRIGITFHKSMGSNVNAWGVIWAGDSKGFSILEDGIAWRDATGKNVLGQDEWWWVKAYINGTQVKGKTWKDGSTEPETWNVTSTMGTNYLGNKASGVYCTNVNCEYEVITWCSYMEENCYMYNSTSEQTFTTIDNTLTFDINSSSNFVQSAIKMYPDNKLYSINYTQYNVSDTADTIPPQITNHSIIASSNESVTVQFTFNENSNITALANITYFSNATIQNPNYLTFTGLTPNSTYEINITNFCDISENCNTSFYFFNITTDITVADTCTYTSGNWEIECSDNCFITTEYNLDGNNITAKGTGKVTFTSPPINWAKFEKQCIVEVRS